MDNEKEFMIDEKRARTESLAEILGVCEHDCNSCRFFYPDPFEAGRKMQCSVIGISRVIGYYMRKEKPTSITHEATIRYLNTCPGCGNVMREKYPYCHYCGQRLKWDEDKLPF